MSNCGPAGFCDGNASCVGACGDMPICSSTQCRCNVGFIGDGHACSPARPRAVSELRAPTCFMARFITSVGAFTIEAHRDWSPYGVDRLYSLLRASYYDDTRIYRVVPGWVAQFGYSGVPLLQSVQTIIPDDPVVPNATGYPTSNRRGVLAFSAAYDSAMTHATNRTTELYINLANHPQLDALGFTPIAIVTSGLEQTVDAFYAGYGEMSDACGLHGFRPCLGPAEADILGQGDAYLDDHFPNLTRILSAAVMPTSCVTGGAGSSPEVEPEGQPPGQPPAMDGPAMIVLLLTFIFWVLLCALIGLLLRSDWLRVRICTSWCCRRFSSWCECLCDVNIKRGAAKGMAACVHGELQLGEASMTRTAASTTTSSTTSAA
jgi:cyclophilin family peptidyl-prolyl cis-trans isomerase